MDRSTIRLFTPDEVAFARKVWEVPNGNHLSSDECMRAIKLGFMSGNLATNLCNDVCHGYRHAKITG